MHFSPPCVNCNQFSDSFPFSYLPGRCVRSFSVLAINSTCVSLSWSLLDNSSVPLFMVVQWSPLRQEGSDHHKGQSGETWARLPYTDRPIYLRGNMSSSLSVWLLTVCYQNTRNVVYTITHQKQNIKHKRIRHQKLVTLRVFWGLEMVIST